ncbi:hypothetical protein ACPCTK_12000 [Streptomyces pseudogriseolus]|uniref:hypothetical protein n=1 Tax=Streptomyces pseudogriseolus TaxID=36817 RepID=UPI003FA2A8B7
MAELQGLLGVRRIHDLRLLGRPDRHVREPQQQALRRALRRKAVQVVRGRQAAVGVEVVRVVEVTRRGLRELILLLGLRHTTDLGRGSSSPDPNRQQPPSSCEADDRTFHPLGFNKIHYG